jgi:hypothetical protein
MKSAFNMNSLIVTPTIASTVSVQIGDCKRGPTPSAAPQQSAELQSFPKAFAGKWRTTHQFVNGVVSPKAGSGTGEKVWGPGLRGSADGEDHGVTLAIQAGQNNHHRVNARVAFDNHPGAFPDRILYSVHRIP